MRTFVALRPPPEAVAHLEAVLPRWPSAPERWHLTLAFLDEVARPLDLEDDLLDVCAAAPPLSLQLAGSGTFGRNGPVWVGVRGDVLGLAALAGDVARACRARGIDVERRPYRPHLTVGRRGRPSPQRLASYEGPGWQASEVELVVSRLGPTVEHEVVGRYPLGG